MRLCHALVSCAEVGAGTSWPPTLELGLAWGCYYDQLAGERVADLTVRVRGTSRPKLRESSGPGASAPLLRPALSAGERVAQPRMRD